MATLRPPCLAESGHGWLPPPHLGGRSASGGVELHQDFVAGDPKGSDGVEVPQHGVLELGGDVEPYKVDPGVIDLAITFSGAHLGLIV